MRAAVGLALAAALAGCKYSPNIRPGVVECQPGGPPCPQPYVCVAQAGGGGRCDLPGKAVDGPAEEREDTGPPGGKPDVATLQRDAGADGSAGAGGAGGVGGAGGIGGAVSFPDTGAPPDAPGPDLMVPGDGPPVQVDAPPDSGPQAYVCPLGRGPDMVNVGSPSPFCIDTTEVTNLQYKAFLDDPKVDQLLQPELCRSRNTGYAPSTSDGGGLNVTTRADHPVVNVDWCDAYAFCKWAGKRLCGTIGGGPLAPGAATVPSVSQWSHACTRGGINAYPYGLGFNRSACNIGRSEFPVNTVPVRSKTSCIGGYVGIYDMVGNVEEWVDFCRNDPAEGWVCGVIGGPYTASDQEAHCGEFYDDPIVDHWVARGFRCCAP